MSVPVMVMASSILDFRSDLCRAARIGFSITAGGTHYLTSLQLAPGETRAINIRKLRDAQVADFLGNKIPAGATDGSVNWVRLDSVPVEGRLIVIQKQQGMAVVALEFRTATTAALIQR